MSAPRTTITVKASLVLPQPNNYFKIEGTEMTMDVADISDADIRAIGNAMTLDLLANATTRREIPKAKS